MDPQQTPAPATTGDEPDPLDDLAAELDDTDPADGADDAFDEEDAPQYAGICRDGPYAGRTIVSRYPQGFWLVDRLSGYYWVYALGSDGFRWQGSMEKIDEAELAATAAGSDYDVLAYDPQTEGTV
jgi:hypothetical protein